MSNKKITQEVAIAMCFLSQKCLREVRPILLRNIKNLGEEIFDFSNILEIDDDLLREARDIIDRCGELQIDVISFFSEEYPENLLEIFDWPSSIFSFGSICNRPRVAIVGSRNASGYGIKIAKSLARELTMCGVGVVSGLAYGIDRAAHEGAIEGARLSGNSAGIAVLASGLNEVYPSEHADLSRRIVDGAGAVLSEHAPDIKPRRHFFLQRNRIISGLCDAVIVVEAKERSGALSTARHALEHGREVFAVPGQIDSANSSGTNNLIQQGAVILRRAEDVIEFLCERGLTIHKHPAGGCVDEDIGEGLSQKILKILRQYPSDFDTLVSKLNLEPVEILSAIGHLELNGVIAVDSFGVFSPVNV